MIFYINVSVSIKIGCIINNNNYIHALASAVLNTINPKDIGDSSILAPLA